MENITENSTYKFPTYIGILILVGVIFESLSLIYNLPDMAGIRKYYFKLAILVVGAILSLLYGVFWLSNKEGLGKEIKIMVVVLTGIPIILSRFIKDWVEQNFSEDLSFFINGVVWFFIFLELNKYAKQFNHLVKNKPPFIFFAVFSLGVSIFVGVWGEKYFITRGLEYEYFLISFTLLIIDLFLYIIMGIRLKAYAPETILPQLGSIFITVAVSYTVFILFPTLQDTTIISIQIDEKMINIISSIIDFIIEIVPLWFALAVLVANEEKYKLFNKKTKK